MEKITPRRDPRGSGNPDGEADAQNVPRPEDGVFISESGVTVTVERIPQPDCPNRSRLIEIRYGDRKRPGTVVWYPDVPRCWPDAHRIIGYFCDDRDNLGRPFSERSPQEAVESGSGGDPDPGQGDISVTPDDRPEQRRNAPASVGSFGSQPDLQLDLFAA